MAHTHAGTLLHEQRSTTSGAGHARRSTKCPSAGGPPRTPGHGGGRQVDERDGGGSLPPARAIGGRNGRHLNPILVQMPAVRQLHVGPGHGDDRHIHAVARRRRIPRRHHGEGCGAAPPRGGAGLVVVLSKRPLPRHLLRRVGGG
jgi:hypothetical protein